MLRSGSAVPSALVHDRFVASPFTVADMALDYEAYLASPDVIRVHSDGRWPVDGFTPAEARRLAGIHQGDHEAGRAFTFMLLDPSRERSLGCVYVNPLHDYLERVGADRATVADFPRASAMVTFWLRQDRQETALPGIVAAALDEWLAGDWPLDDHVFRVLPGESSSCVALQRLGLRRVQPVLRGEHRPYLWFRHGPVA